MTKKMLIVEDIEAKRLSIEEVVRSCIPGVTVKLAASVKSAVRILESEVLDFVVLDMSLPTFDVSRAESGGTPRPLGGVEIFSHLDGYGVTVPVIVVSAYGTLEEAGTAITLNELATRLKNDYPKLFRGCVLFDSVYTVWAEELKRHIKEVTSK